MSIEGRVIALTGLLIVAVSCRPERGHQAQPEFREMEAETEIRSLLDAQQEAWNARDLEGFMAGYWRSEDLAFGGGGKVNRGWEWLWERYQKAYFTRGDPGELRFEDLEIHVLSPDAAWVLGRWELRRGEGDSGGAFTLILRRFDGDWRIVHDHTSSLPRASRAE